MNAAGDLETEVEQLRKRLTRMSKASLDINENLDFTAIYRGVPDYAWSLTGNRYGMMTLMEVTVGGY